MDVPTLLFINKIDRMGVDIEAVLSEIRKQLTPAICVLQEVENAGSREASVRSARLQADDALIELLSTVDETLLLDYLDGDEIDDARLRAVVTAATAARAVYPVVFGSALNGMGIDEILDTINCVLPPFKPLPTSEPSGVVFKVARLHGKTGRVCMIKLTAGEVAYRGTLGADKVTGLSRWRDGQIEPVDRLGAGDIGMVTGLHHLRVGDTFGQGIRSKGFALGKPTLKVKIRVDRPTQRVELLEVLTVMADNDPYLSYQLNAFNDDIYITLFGYVQMEIVAETLRRDYGIEIEMTDPMTIYMETPVKTAEAAVTMYEDGLPYHAAVGFRVDPLPVGSGIIYTSNVPTGHLKQTFQNGVVDGVHAYLDQGLMGWELTDMKITLISYEFSSPVSTPSDYRDLSPLVLFEALKRAGTKLLWPMAEYQLAVPTVHMGRAMSDLQQMKATMDDPQIQGDVCTVTGVLPVDLSHNYALDVHRYTGGMGHFESKVIGYEDAPPEMVKERPRFKLDPANRAEYLLGIVRPR